MNGINARRTRLALAIVVRLLCLSVLFPGEGQACSVDDSYRTPTNFELVQRADLIILARVVRGPRELDGVSEDRFLEIELVRVLKGEPGPTAPRLVGAIAWNGRAIPSMPTPLYTSHFSAGLGACVRMFYPVGGLVVAMFEHSPEGLIQITDPWARSVEDVEGPTGVWVRAIEEYLSIQTEGGGDVRQAIEVRRDSLRSRPDDMAAQAIAFDLDRHLAVIETGRTRRPPHWLQIDMPLESGAVTGNAESQEFAILYCRQGDAGIRVEAVGFDQPAQLTFVVDGRERPIQNVTVGEREGRPALVGTLTSTVELMLELQQASDTVELRVGSSQRLAAPPADSIQKFALRCASLLSPGLR